jgi:hypothetical protein
MYVTGIGQYSMTVIDHPGSADISIKGLASRIKVLSELEENLSVAGSPTNPVLLWIGDAKRTASFACFFTALQGVMWDENGNEIITKARLRRCRSCPIIVLFSQ